MRSAETDTVKQLAGGFCIRRRQLDLAAQRLPDHRLTAHFLRHRTVDRSKHQSPQPPLGAGGKTSGIGIKRGNGDRGDAVGKKFFQNFTVDRHRQSDGGIAFAGTVQTGDRQKSCPPQRVIFLQSRRSAAGKLIFCPVPGACRADPFRECGGDDLAGITGTVSAGSGKFPEQPVPDRILDPEVPRFPVPPVKPVAQIRPRKGAEIIFFLQQRRARCRQLAHIFRSMKHHRRLPQLYRHLGGTFACRGQAAVFIHQSQRLQRSQCRLISRFRRGIEPAQFLRCCPPVCQSQSQLGQFRRQDFRPGVRGECRFLKFIPAPHRHSRRGTSGTPRSLYR